MPDAVVENVTRFDMAGAIRYAPQRSPWTNALNPKIEMLRSTLRSVAEGAARLKEAGFDDLAAELRLSLAKIRRELNHLEAVKDHPDLFV